MGLLFRAALLAALTALWSCSRQPASAPESGKQRATAHQTPAVAGAKLIASNATGCAPGTRCLSVDDTGRPQATGTFVAQCRGRFADFIVPKDTIPAGYNGPWFTPHLIETAQTGIPQGARPWSSVDPQRVDARLRYLLTLRNYAFSSDPVRSLTPQLTAETDYSDPAGHAVPANQRSQKWYAAPRMTYGLPSQPGTREIARGMTLERTVTKDELGGNTVGFHNYAVAYYDTRGARTYARVWSTTTPGIDKTDRAQMRFSEGALVYKLLFSAARPADFPQDLLDGSLGLDIRPNAGGAAVHVRLLQIDIAVKDARAGPTGWYFATYAFDRSVAGTSPWRKMVPVGLMWGNDPTGAPIDESWINPSAPAYATAHLGAGGRLNGPVDNRASACMSCHSTAQAPSLANMLPPASGPCRPMRASWFRNIPGTEAFGRFDPQPPVCETSLSGLTLSAADYSLQLAATVTRALTPSLPSFNPCTWDDANPPSVAPPIETLSRARIFPVTRDPGG
jgi:hypothetical protein